MTHPHERSDGALTSAPVSSVRLTGGAVSLPVEMVSDPAAGRPALYAALVKLRLSSLVLVVTALGFALGAAEPINLAGLLHTVGGTALVAFSASIFNQYIERRRDRRMDRTAGRPIPSGRISSVEALAVAWGLAVCGLAWLLLTAGILPCLLAAGTLLLYVVVYTPLKTRTAWNTLVGAVPGAIPPVIGYAAAAGRLDVQAALLFGLLFCWQMPHFYAIAWMYRRDYARGGFRMLSVVDPSGIATVRETLIFSGLLAVLSLVAWLSLAPPALSVGVGLVLLNAALLAVAVGMARGLCDTSARRMMWASIAYLPLLFGLLLANHLLSRI